MHGRKGLGGTLGKHRYADAMLFFDGGKVNAPETVMASGSWRITCLWVPQGNARRPQGIVDQIILSDLYREVAAEMNIPVPDDDMAPFAVTLDNVRFDPADPVAYVQRYGGP